MRSSQFFFLSVSLSVLLSGCSAKDYIKSLASDASEPVIAPLVDIETRAKIIKLWSKDTGKGYREEFSKLLPAYIQGKVLVVDFTGYLSNLDASNGNTIWQSDADIPVTGGPGVSEELAIVGTEEGELLAYSIETGSLLWQSTVSSEILSVPQIAGDIAVTRTIDGKIFALDVDNGNLLWVYDLTVPPLTLRGTSSPVISDDVVIVGFDGGHLVALELQTGRLIWETTVSLASGRSQLERIVDIDSDPIVVANDIYVTTFQGELSSIALESGRLTWTRDISSYVGLAADEKNVYITDEQSHVWCLDRLTGSSLWKQELLELRMVSKPAIVGDFIVVGDVEGYLHWLDKTSGEFLARIKNSSDPIMLPPIAIEDIVYVYNNNGTLSAYTYQ